MWIKRKALVYTITGGVIVGLILCIYFALRPSSPSLRATNTLTPDDIITTPTPEPTIDPSLPDPATENFVLHALAIGDWGSTPGKPGYEGSCCNKYRQTGTDTPAYFQDFWSQINIASMLARSAGKLKPKVIIGHGDNFYWNGLGPEDVDVRFQQAFEGVYNQKELKNIPWVNVMGNHDYGGSAYICMERDNRFRRCRSTEEMLRYLTNRFTLQSQYVSPQGDRWKMPDHYYKYSIQQANVSIDIFNVDTNYADSHGARQICCQCYGYSKGSVNCNIIDRGDKFCAGGDTEMYDACFQQLQDWSEQSLRAAKVDIEASKADWKIINSHYSPHFHMAPTKRDQWLKLLSDSNVQVFLNGHSHGENHDHGPEIKTHFFENGAGGGIQSETSGVPPPTAKDLIKNIWIGDGAPYGFFEISASKEWIRMRFITFAEDWAYSLDKAQIEKGSNKVGHCWYIPRDGSYGKACATEQWIY